MPEKPVRRTIEYILFFLSMALIGLVIVFTRIPSARAYIPLQVARTVDIYDWSPDAAPGWYHVDNAAAPQSDYFKDRMGEAVVESDQAFDRYLAVMNWVREQAVLEDAAQAIPGDPITVHQAMLDGIPAQCGNFATLMVAGAASLNLTDIRMWHLLSYDGPGGEGHVANEVWDADLQKWVFFDPMNNSYVLLDGQPASLVEVRQILLTDQDERLTVVRGANAFTPEDEVFDLYRQVMIAPSLVTSNTPLSTAYNNNLVRQIVNLTPDVVGLPSLVESGLRLMSGESRQIILIDDLTRRNSQPLPIMWAKLVFFSIITVAGLLVLMTGRVIVMWRRTRRLTTSAQIARSESAIQT